MSRPASCLDYNVFEGGSHINPSTLSLWPSLQNDVEEPRTRAPIPSPGSGPPHSLKPPLTQHNLTPHTWWVRSKTTAWEGSWDSLPSTPPPTASYSNHRSFDRTQSKMSSPFFWLRRLPEILQWVGCPESLEPPFTPSTTQGGKGNEWTTQKPPLQKARLADSPAGPGGWHDGERKPWWWCQPSVQPLLRAPGDHGVAGGLDVYPEANPSPFSSQQNLILSGRKCTRFQEVDHNGSKSLTVVPWSSMHWPKVGGAGDPTLINDT